MEIRFKTNRKSLLRIFVPLTLMCYLIIIGMLIHSIFDRTVLIEERGSFVAIIVMASIMSIITLVAICLKKQTFIFNKEKIIVVDKNGKMIKSIDVKNIKSMVYNRFRLYQLLVPWGIWAPEGPQYYLNIEEANGEKCKIGITHYTDIRKLKTLYNELLTIRYDKRGGTRYENNKDR